MTAAACRKCIAAASRFVLAACEPASYSDLASRNLSRSSLDRFVRDDGVGLAEVFGVRGRFVVSHCIDNGPEPGADGSNDDEIAPGGDGVGLVGTLSAGEAFLPGIHLGEALRVGKKAGGSGVRHRCESETDTPLLLLVTEAAIQAEPPSS